jgi:hypothetical protein
MTASNGGLEPNKKVASSLTVCLTARDRQALQIMQCILSPVRRDIRA